MDWAYASLLVLIIFIWTPPHFWALAIFRREDYAKAKIPMLPVTHGVAYTRKSIMAYPSPRHRQHPARCSGHERHVLLGGAVVLNAVFLWYAAHAQPAG